MLISLHVKNLALIDEEEIIFEDGLNILSGETGAGKSIIIGSVNMALGAKADSSMIRTGAEYALIELVFAVSNPEALSKLKELDIPVEEDGTLILQRKIMENRSICKAGGETVSVRQLKEISNLLINIHGQNDNQELLHRKKHREILDEFAGGELSALKDECSRLYGEWKAAESELADTDMDESRRARELDLAEFELGEIDGAEPVEGEDEELEAKYRRMVNSRKIAESVNAVAEITGAGESESNASEQIGRAIRELSSVTGYDEGLSELADQLSDIDNLLSDFRHSLSSYLDSLEFDGEDFARTEDRLNTINRLKDKYGGSIEAVLAYRDEKQEQIARLKDFESYRNDLIARDEKLKKELLAVCEKISEVRQKNAGLLSEKLRSALEDLNFIDVRFETAVTVNEESITPEGYDDVEFMISTNPGEAMRPLANVASGGELSRIMLAIKTVAAGRDDYDTLIFDEIDAGISGQTAWKVSEKLGVLSSDHQIICITHLPQIAAMADVHFEIRKETTQASGQERTFTRISRLSEDARAAELARMLGGAVISDTALLNARDMIDQAKKVKQR